MCADRNDTVVRYALSGATQPMAVSGYTHDALPAAEQAALPSDTRVAAALEAPVDVDGPQLTLAEYLESVGAEPAGPGHAKRLTASASSGQTSVLARPGGYGE